MIDEYVTRAQESTVISQEKLSPFFDLTCLNDDAQTIDIEKLCELAIEHHAAAICIYPKFISFAKKILHDTSIKIASVVNFPQGNLSIDETTKQIADAIELGADEIDIVFPYQSFLQGEQSFCDEFISASKKMCENHLLKVILETGELKQIELISNATRLAVDAGADFIKTSTGKTAVGATYEAAATILLTLRELGKKTQRIGFKASGGIRTLTQASIYCALMRDILGESSLTPERFRFGVSRLLS